MYGLHGVRCSFQEADTCMLYSLGFNCRGGGWYVMCAKSVAVTWPCGHCFDKNYHCLLQISASVSCVLVNFV